MRRIKQHHLFVKYNKYVRFLFFCFVGTVAALLTFLFFNLFRFVLGLNFSLSLVLAIVLSMVFNFSVNRNVTFSAKGYSIKKQIAKYLALYVVSMGSNVLVATITRSILGGGVLLENVAVLSGLLVSIPISFFGSKFWVFKKN